jgi:hypothetical protein
MDIKCMDFGGCGEVSGSFRHGRDFSGSIKCEEFLHRPSDTVLFKKDCSPFLLGVNSVL